MIDGNTSESSLLPPALGKKALDFAKRRLASQQFQEATGASLTPEDIAKDKREHAELMGELHKNFRIELKPNIKPKKIKDRSLGLEEDPLDI